MVLILAGAVATILVARKPVPESFRYDFEKIYRLYDEKKYEEAAFAYRELLDKYNVESADLYFNLANANFKADHIGPAIFYYKKALKLKPNDQEIQFNLQFARQQHELDPDEKKTWFKEKFAGFMNLTSIHRALKLAIVFYWLFLLGLALALFIKRPAMTYICIGFGIVFVLMSGYTLTKHCVSAHHREGVVLKEKAPVKYSYEEDDDTAFTLPGGATVDIINSRKSWHQIRLSDGRGGWIKADDLGEI